MKYHYRDGVKRDKKKPVWILWLALTIILAFAAYMAANYVAPRLVSMPLSAKATPDATMNKMQATSPKDQEKHLYIPQLNVDLPITSDVGSLKDNALQDDESGDPEDGAPLTIKALRFSLESNPWETRDSSPFYNLGKLQPGDELYVDHNGKRLAYRVKTLHGEPPAAEVVQPEDKKSILLLMPVDEQGGFAGGAVIEAESVGVVATAWSSDN
jgi:sortase (surface protein transpeptidase)